ncbi:Gfo/Idh/MocA family protein [Oligosphaera ethanolica]|uniref:Dehydrogenase n=1 Tax=Oligosphaera ethanolica TaxID=760260 RepID=A0AAE3VH32_9BACT|nr:Gfo/Idh/MocA family oxidoreductase [Oligosphaera ethanolica]MDQ0290136.1 putative dehydrogenase [Oligosphaera ethanolica]
MKQYKIMIAGAANPHIPQYLRGCAPAGSNRQLVAVSDPDPQRLAAARDLVGAGADAVAWYGDYHAMFDAHADADMVIIGSDNRDHFAMFCEAVRRKLHIFTMKVISMDEDECREMLAMQAGYDRVIATELELHFHPQFIQARDMVRAGAIGELQSVYLSNISQSPCNYYPNWGTPELSYGKRVALRPGATVFRGGAITDHPHPYDLIRWITGREFRSVKAMSATNQRSALEVEDHAAITGELSGGVKYFVNPSYSNLEEQVSARRLLWPKSLECNLKVTGSKGYLSADFFDRHCYVVGKNCVSPDRLIVELAPRYWGGADDSRLGNFIAAIEGRRAAPECSLADSYAAVRVMNAAYESLWHDREIILDV